MRNLILDVLNKAILIFVLFMHLLFIPNCKDANIYKPPVDSLIPPPPPPVLLTPPDSFVHIPQGGNRLYISWEIIEGADSYEINFVDLNIMKQWTYTLDTNYVAQNWLECYSRFTWRVRAYGPTWEYYTDWSMPRFFEVVAMPFEPPKLEYPPYDTIFYSDSLPVYIDLIWSEVPRARFYDYQVFINGNIIFQNTIYSTQDVILVDSVATYYWCVRANSPLWEFPTGWAGGKFTVLLR